jgi:hypothetical protein
MTWFWRGELCCADQEGQREAVETPLTSKMNSSGRDLGNTDSELLADHQAGKSW